MYLPGPLMAVPARHPRHQRAEEKMMTSKQSSRGRKQDQARLASGQDYEVRYESKKTGRSKVAVKKAVK
jgi:hypothetical protein